MSLAAVTRAFGKAGLMLKNKSPEILVAAGIIGGVTATVLACKATKKADAVLEKHHAEIEKIHTVKEQIDAGEIDDEYTDEDVKKDTVIAYRDTGLAMAKVYGPAIIVGTLSVASILTGFGILRSRYLALGAAYTALDKAFKAYRSRVVNEAGKDADKHYMYGNNFKIHKVTDIDENGKTVTKKVNVDIIAPDALYSPFSKIFDETNPNYTRDAGMNRFFLATQMDAMNKLLKTRGYVYLNEVYKALGFPQTQAGTLFGWIYDPENEDHEGDNYINFNLFDVAKEDCVDFLNGYVPSVIIDFNVDDNQITNLLPLAVC